VLNKFAALFSATLIAQLISFLALPVISRLITPYEFGLFFFYSSIAGLIGGIASGKIEQLYFSHELSSINFLLSRTYMAIAGVVAISVVVISLAYFLIDLSIPGWLLLPIGILGTASLIPNYFYLLKLKDTKKIATSRVLLALMQAGFQLIFCLIEASYVALLVGLYLAQLCTAVYLYLQVKQHARENSEIQRQAVKIEHKLLIYGVSASSLQTLNTSFLPSFFVIFKYLDLSGFVAALHRLFMVPVNLLASVISHMVLAEFKDSAPKVMKMLWVLLTAVLILDLGLYYFAEKIGDLIVWFLGDNWHGVKPLVKYLLLIYSLIFFSVIVNQACVARKLQGLFMWGELVKLLAVLSAFYLAATLQVADIMELYALIVSFAMLICILFPMFILQKKVKLKPYE